MTQTTLAGTIPLHRRGTAAAQRRVADWRSSDTGHRVWPGPLIGAAALGLLAGVFAVTPVGQTLEEKFGLWALYQLRGPIPPAPDMVIIALRRNTGERIAVRRDPLGDDPCADLRVDATPATHRTLGDVPERWGRCHHVALLRQLKRAAPRTVVFDVMFRPRDDTPHAEDRALGAAMRELGNVIVGQTLKAAPESESTVVDEQPAPLSRDIADAALGRAPIPLPSTGPDKFDRMLTFKEAGWHAPTLPSVALQAYLIDAYPALLAVAQRLAPQSAALLPQSPDALRRDGRMDLHALHLRSVFRQLAAERGGTGPLLEALASSETQGQTHTTGGTALLRLYAGENQFWLNFYGPPRTIRTIDMPEFLAVALTNPAPDPFGLRDKAVFVGYSDDADWALQERFATSIGAGRDRLSGVEIIATAFANLLDGTQLSPVGSWGRFAAAAAAGFGVALLCYAASSSISSMVVAAAAGVYVVAAVLLFSRLHLWAPLLGPLAVAAPAALAYAYGYKLRDYRRDRAALHYILEQFVPHEVVDVLAHNARHLGRIRETLDVACLMTDIQGYTTLSARLAPDKVADLLAQYFEAIFRPIADYGGFVSDLKGDSILAIWTDPKSDSAVRHRVCSAALALRDAVDRFNEAHPQSPLPTRIGVHYGPAALGPVGAPGHYEYRAVGDTVNTASRVEDLSKELDTQLLVTDAVVDGLEGVVVRDLGDFPLRGRRAPTRIFELVAAQDQCSEDQRRLCAAFAAGLAAYEAGRIGDARSQFGSILNQFPEDGPSAYYLRRIIQVP